MDNKKPPLINWLKEARDAIIEAILEHRLDQRARLREREWGLRMDGNNKSGVSSKSKPRLTRKASPDFQIKLEIFVGAM